ncbi:hypothetical protein B0H14DRAFT_240548 [Mycena olivaceomarginata]|nr:hypothetical protein B0H14DRAFT_240548 [Mycena olivaceomarginata]
MASSVASSIPSPKDDPYLHKLWDSIREVLDHVMENPNEPLSNDVKISVHGDVQKYCTYRDKKPGDGDLVRVNLYDELTKYFEGHLGVIVQNAKSRQDEDTQWESYTAAADRIHHLFHYFNVNWITRSRQREGKQIYEVKTLAVALWWKSLKDVLGLVMENPKVSISNDVKISVYGVVQNYFEEPAGGGDLFREDAELKKYFEERLRLIVQVSWVRLGRFFGRGIHENQSTAAL